MARDIAVDQRAGRHHLCIQPCVARDLAMKDPTVAVGPIHHRGDRDSATGDGAAGARWNIVFLYIRIHFETRLWSHSYGGSRHDNALRRDGSGIDVHIAAMQQLPIFEISLQSVASRKMAVSNY
jgi:hypothetical protein